ncbi:hypothetical protein SAMN04488570_1311 [Nocardioides scoriae]|uniref:DUF559 domain-containing protein n=1 Tax=Nocardioides scoriae TaxID=642780 RepID=A0A1H1Q3S0_9ACTN|nr:hypothetical protein [Nocardioides scoriae]SDS18148.1 hypothetical protein SAMN04488570_1311 [Nocardioides scoriae]
MPHRWEPTAPWPTDLVRPVAVDPLGVAGPTRREAAGPYWVRTSTARYVPADTDRTRAEQRVLEQAERLPPAGAVTGWAACRVHGAAFFDGLADDGRTRLPVPLAVGPSGRLRGDPGATAVHHVLLPSDRAHLHGIATVVPVRAAYDAVRLAAGPRGAVVALDMALAAGLTTLEQLAAYADQQPRDRRTVLRAAGFATPHSRSPRESRLRLAWLLDARLPAPLVNPTIRDRAGRFLGIADLLDPVAGLVAEYDGADHRTSRRQAADLGREDRLRRVGLEVARFSGPDLADRALVVRRLLEARARCRFDGDLDRAWVAIAAS